MADSPALELRQITKRFGTLVANRSVDFELRRGEIHALLGENGAGKSTLMNVLYGLHQPDEGEILLGGEPVTIDSARRAIGLGIGMVHQHFMLVPVMTVAENLVLGAEPSRGPLLDYKAAAARDARAVGALRPGGRSRRPGARISASAPSSAWRSCARCSAAPRCSCSTSRPRCSPRRRRRTCSASCARWRPRAPSIIFISHKLNEVLDVADRDHGPAARREDRHGARPRARRSARWRG